MSCAHQDFDGSLIVHRLHDTYDGTNLRCMVDVRVTCADCQVPLHFVLPQGVNLEQGATMSPDAAEARLVAVIGTPRSSRVPGFGIREQ